MASVSVYNCINNLIALSQELLKNQFYPSILIYKFYSDPPAAAASGLTMFAKNIITKNGTIYIQYLEKKD
ncbi:hypothetical protein BpHYR1_013037 [Brachionus plicatilis]|uniref:Uncharacterized protein n=1 Tax=Brachionus plicatilis TaxID=10195 RepID=A0A3M7SIC1_BRAPC|nr:hypothetical protein BpHYR1_013037 [Brachionus plicatilis]